VGHVGRRISADKLKETMIAQLKANPGKLNYALTGVGTQLHIGMELFKLMSRTDIAQKWGDVIRETEVTINQ
jgi:tripartite-type tricarboxylate transporter receptor subunit TctC